jgi:GrpB-like predicted nucleotidyltransferase (UPF0157 family)
MTTVPAIRCRTYQQLTQALAARRRQLGLTQLDVDARAGLQSSYTGKLEIGTRHLGSLSLPMLCAALDIDILVMPRSAVARARAATSCISIANRTRRATMAKNTKEPVSPGHRANDIARGVAPQNKPTIIGREHEMSVSGGPFIQARHGVRKAGPENPKNAR